MNNHNQIAATALATRILLLLAMSISCAILPDFDPGGDVLRFHLRLDDSSSCFCAKGHACDSFVSLDQRSYDENSRMDIISCVESQKDNDGRFYLIDGLYRFILPPVTKWDSARFLTLAVDPLVRHPNLTWSYAAKDDGNNFNHHDAMFHSSEQSHAFLPFFPLCIRYVANALIVLSPRRFLPSTYEGTVALSAIIINMVAFAIAAMAMYDLTLHLMLGERLLDESRAQGLQKKDKLLDRTNSIHEQDCERISKMVAYAFCLNPAGVFFTAAYSESIFAMLTFLGLAIAVRGRYYKYLRCVKRYQSISAMWYSIPTNSLWALASYTRSNGVLCTSAWWILVGIGTFCCGIADSNRNSSRIYNCVITILYHLIMGFILFGPVLYHDNRGYNIHCMQQSSSIPVPEWCYNADRFSLYAYVQRKHWNVGLFRYYELKQIPNFILAAPILVVSYWAVSSWIHTSLNRHNISSIGPLPRNISDGCTWAFSALSASAIVCSGCRTDKINLATSAVERNTVNLLLGCTLLPYYAILFGFAVVGTFLAHVQISTRLICSSCPAFYWFIVMLYSQNKISACNVSIRWMICFYFVLYNLLGVIMHVNWLPWT